MENPFDILLEKLAVIEVQNAKILELLGAEQKALPAKLNIHRAAALADRTPNALRIQVSLGNLKASKAGNRLMFETEYLKKWISGDLPEQQPDFVKEKIDPANFIKERKKQQFLKAVEACSLTKAIKNATKSEIENLQGLSNRKR
jgi:hypothetical protein